MTAILSSNPLRFHHINENKALLLSMEGLTIEGDSLDLAILYIFRNEGTLERKLFEISARYPEILQSNVAARVQKLIHFGLIRTCHESGFTILVDPASERLSNLKVGIVTAERPRQLYTCLETWKKHLCQYERTVSVLVVDGSISTKVQTRNRAICRYLSTPSCVIRYIGRQAQAQLMRRLSDFSVNKAALSFALDRPGGIWGAGTNRNVLLLLTAGTSVFCVDDDVIASAWRSPNYTEGLALAKSRWEHDRWSFRTRSDALKFAGTFKVDLLESHFNVVGKTSEELRSILGTVGRTRWQCGINSRFDDWRVRVTMGAIAGDGGSNSPFTALFSPEQRRSEGAANENLTNSLNSREVVRSAASISLLEPGEDYMALSTTWDNTRLLPPFFPLYRGEDSIFGQVLRICHPSAMVAHLPIGTVHASDRASSYESNVWPNSKQVSNAFLLNCVLASYQRLGTTEDVALYGALGTHLSIFGSLSQKEMVYVLSDLVAKRQARELSFLEGNLSGSSDATPERVAATNSYVRSVLEALKQPDHFLPSELEGSFIERLRRLQELITKYGDLMREWPTIWRAASEIRASEDTL